MKKREPAWRILSGEFNAANVVLKSSGKTEPNYILSPLGAMINRVFIIGKAIGMDDIGKDSRSFYRIRLSDPTGIFYLAIGEYQPAAMEAISKIELPSYLAVIGKVKTFEPENGGLYLSIRPEFIYQTTAEMSDHWLLNSAISLKNRIEALEEAQKMDNPTIDNLRALGYTTVVAEGIKKAVENYGRKPLDPYRIFLKDALQALVDNGGIKDPAINAVGISGDVIDNSNLKTTTFTPEKLAFKESVDDVDAEAIEKSIIEIIGSTPTNKKQGVNWNELLSQVKKKGIERKSAEAAVRELMEKGIVYEPMIGILKMI